ncbi:32294_t:CDS:2 [Gigaspora margarita]|uniref:32294_t:CDS:1 n=1 Tax=Gigaspora margarita TaxID=4874 RepID=A0ABN7VTZ8_GIGMA|nr:32294_t:CDS:2 [Gigaspora margarita]
MIEKALSPGLLELTKNNPKFRGRRILAESMISLDRLVITWESRLIKSGGMVNAPSPTGVDPDSYPGR